MCIRCEHCDCNIIASYCGCDSIETAGAYRRRISNIRHRMAEASRLRDDTAEYDTISTKSTRWWAMGHRRRGPIAR